MNPADDGEIALAALAGRSGPLREALADGLPEAWGTTGELLAAAGLWGVGGAAAGLALALLLAPVAARWTRGGWAAGCAWAVLLSVGLGAGGLYGGAVYGVALQGERLVQEGWLLERLAATTLLVVAEERGLDTDGANPISPMIAEARRRLDTRVATASFPGSTLLGSRLPGLVRPVLDALGGVERLTTGDLHGLRLGAGGSAAAREQEARLSVPARDLLASTAPIRSYAVATIRAAAFPHLVAAGIFAGATVALIFVIGVISRLVGRRRAVSPSGGRPG